MNGDHFITNDTVIEVNGEPLTELEYPASFRQSGGWSRRVVSRDPRLADLLQQGGQVTITVFNRLTNQRSEPFVLSIDK